MLVQIGEKCWIKAEKINAINLYHRGKNGVWEIIVHTVDNKYIHDTYGDKDEALRNLTNLGFTTRGCGGKNMKRHKHGVKSIIRWNRSDRLVRKEIQRHWNDDSYAALKPLYGWTRRNKGQRKSRIKQCQRFYKYCLVNAKHLFKDVLDSQIKRASKNG